MKLLFVMFLSVAPLLSMAEEARGRFVVSMTIVESCLLTDQGIQKCTTGMREPTVVQDKGVVKTPEGSDKRIVTVVTY